MEVQEDILQIYRVLQKSSQWHLGAALVANDIGKARGHLRAEP